VDVRDTGLALTLIGPPSASWRGVGVAFPTRKALAIVAYVAVAEVPAERDELAELLWPGAGRRNLRGELYRLRRLPGAEAWLDVREDGVALRARSDLAAFRTALREERFEDAVDALPDGEELLRGFAVPGAAAFDEWLEVERTDLAARMRDALRGRAAELERDGRLRDALGVARRLVDLDPLDESAHRTVMRLEYARGHVAGALAQFEALRRRLVEEVGAEPMPETRAMARDIERHAFTAPIVHVRPTPRIPLALLRPPTLVGRADAWAQLEDAYAAGKTANVSGPPGVGKTRLVLDFVRSKGPAFLLDGRPGDATLPYASLSRALLASFRAHPALLTSAPPWVRAEVAGIAPSLPEAARVPHGAGDRLRLFEALMVLMGGLRQSVRAIVVDDLHDLDPMSFEVGLRAQSSVLTEVADPGHARFFATYRSGELPPGFERSLDHAADLGLALNLELGPLDEAGVRSLLHDVDLGAYAPLADQLRRFTGGNPAFLLETLKSALEIGTLDADALDRIAVPARVERTISARVQRLERPTQRLLRAIAAAGAVPDPELLAEVLGTTPFEVAEGIAELERSQVLGVGGFVHGLLQETVVATTPRAVASLLHRRLATALEGRAHAEGSAAERGSLCTRIAKHWTEGGDARRAGAWRLAAADAYRSAGFEQAAIDVLAGATGGPPACDAPATPGR
jgi:DNA-binding SARP family transcriptional activator